VCFQARCGVPSCSSADSVSSDRNGDVCVGFISVRVHIAMSMPDRPTAINPAAAPIYICAFAPRGKITIRRVQRGRESRNWWRKLYDSWLETDVLDAVRLGTRVVALLNAARKTFGVGVQCSKIGCVTVADS
jgi:hypothetical protein